MRIAVHELKAGLSRYLARARAGEVIEITSHARPVARLVGMAATEHAGIAGLLDSGAAQWRGGKPTLAPAQALGRAGRPLSVIVREDRG